MNESGKHHKRRMINGFFSKYAIGKGIDIGCGLYPFHPGAIGFDKLINPSHDANGYLPYEDNSFDYVHSSHCIEHMENPENSIVEWWRTVKEFGHLIILAPDFGLYEQRMWPSRYNPDHKSKWNLVKLVTLLSSLPGAEVVHASRNDFKYSYEEKRYDRTCIDQETMADIEVIVQKVPLDWMFRSS